MARMAAGVRKRKDGTLEKRFTVNGKQYSVYGKTQKELAEKELAKREEIKKGGYAENRNITLDKYFEEWTKHREKRLKGGTIGNDILVYNNHIKKSLGSRKIKDIEKRELITFVDGLPAELKPTYKNRIIDVFNKILNGAVKDEIIERNPLEAVERFKDDGKKASETIHRALTEEEQKAFMDELKGEYLYDFIALLLCTGMRCGEAAALTWADIDHRNNVIHITKTVTRGKDGKHIIGTPKTKTSKRDIPMNGTIRKLLSDYKAKYQNIFPMGNSLIFQSVYGKYITPSLIDRLITKILQRLDDKGKHIDHFSCHALRDTFATRFIEQGGQPQTLKTILGHSSLAMTMDLYAHVLPNTKQKEMDNLKIAL